MAISIRPVGPVSVLREVGREVGSYTGGLLDKGAGE